MRACSGVDYIYIVWEALMVKNLLDYRLYWSSNETAPWRIVGDTIQLMNVTCYRDYNVERGKRYGYRLEVVKMGNEIKSVGSVPVESSKILLWIPDIEWKTTSGKEAFLWTLVMR